MAKANKFRFSCEYSDDKLVLIYYIKQFSLLVLMKKRQVDGKKIYGSR